MLVKGLFGFAVLLTWEHLRPPVNDIRVRFRSSIDLLAGTHYTKGVVLFTELVY